MKLARYENDLPILSSIIEWPTPAFENYSNPTIEQMTELGFATYAEPVPTPPTLAEVKTQGIATVKQTRQSTLDRYQKYSTGIARIYLDNLFAAQKFLATDISLMATGQTPEQYLTLLGAELGMTALQFANYIIGENIRLGAPDQAIPSAYDVEQRYLRASVGIQYAATAEAVQAIVDDYMVYCQPVTGQ